MKVCALRALGAATLVAAVAAAGCGGKSSADDDERVTIGVSVEKTGPVPALGNALEGVKAAARAINADGGVDGREIELVVRDNAGDPSKAIANVEEFHDRGIDIVIGPVMGQDCEAVAPIVAKNDMVDLCLSTQDLNPEVDERQFGLGVGYTETIGFDVAFLATRGRRIGVLGEKGPSGDKTKSIAERAASGARRDGAGRADRDDRHDGQAADPEAAGRWRRLDLRRLVRPDRDRRRARGDRPRVRRHGAGAQLLRVGVRRRGDEGIRQRRRAGQRAGVPARAATRRQQPQGGDRALSGGGRRPRFGRRHRLGLRLLRRRGGPSGRLDGTGGDREHARGRLRVRRRVARGHDDRRKPPRRDHRRRADPLRVTPQGTFVPLDAER